jgi:hypothetical protein
MPSMCSVARGRTSGWVMRSAVASPWNRSSQVVAISAIVTPASDAPRMILSSTSVMFMTQVTRSPR